MSFGETQPHKVESPGPPNANGSFLVHLEVFEGPLDLLLKLIERKQLDISKVALADVAAAFLQYLEAHPDMPPAPLASFVWVASKLILIKSQALLPRPPVPRPDDEEEDPGDELVRRLEAYKRVQEVAKWLRAREVAGLRSYERPGPLQAARPKPDVAEMSTGLEGVTLAKLMKLVQRRMQWEMAVGSPRGTAVGGHVVTIAEKVAHLRARLSRLKEGGRIPLGSEFVEAAMLSRTELVVLFLAVLEIVRRKHAWAEQDELFGEIWLSRC